MTGAAGLQAIEAYWARRLGCSPADLHRPRVAVVAWPEPVAFACLRSGALVVAAPPGWTSAVAGTLRGLAPGEAFAPERLRAAFGASASELIGPAYQGFADAGDAVQVTTEGVRPLGAGDRAALEALRLAAGETAWAHSAIDPDRPPVFGRFRDGVLVAAATLDGLGEPVASVGVLTRPDHRGHGHGRAVAASATRAALDAGAVAHYQTLDANTPSVAIARALGFRRDATTLAVRLRDPGG